MATKYPAVKAGDSCRTRPERAVFPASDSLNITHGAPGALGLAEWMVS